MTRAKIRWLAAAAVIAVPLLPLALLAWTGAVGGDEDLAAQKRALVPPAESVPLTGTDADWVVGDKYEFVTGPRPAAEIYTGKLLRVDDRWVVLRNYTTATYVTGNWLTSLPVIGSYFWRPVSMPVEAELWIPADKLTLTEHWKGQNMPAVLGPLGDEPDSPGTYTIDWLRRGAVEELQGDLLSISGDDFLVEPIGSGARQTIARDDILSLQTIHRTCADPSEAD